MRFMKGQIPWNKGKTGFKLSEETKKKLSEIKKGKPPNNKGKKLSEKTRLKMSQSRTGQKHHMFGKSHSEETKKKISNSKKGTIPWIKGKGHNEETRLLISKRKTGRTHKGIPRSIETRMKLSESRKNQIIPIQDTSIEIIIQNKLIENNIDFYKHIPIKIEDCYHQVDFLIKPNIIVECDGDYWHSRIISGKNKKTLRIKRDFIIDYQLERLGYKVIRLWEYDINNNLEWCMNLIKSFLVNKIEI